MAKTNIEIRGGAVFEHPLLVGAGIVKSETDANFVLPCSAAGVEVGSVTPERLAGNPGDNFYAHYENGVLLYTQNSLGMPNAGKDAFTEFAPAIVAKARSLNKRVGINVAADTAIHLWMMVVWADQFGFDWITINPACPNKFKDGKPVSLFYYDDVELTRFLIKLASTELKTPIWWKFSPDNDTLGHQLRVMDYLTECPPITGLVFNNTVPHTLTLNENGKPSIEMKYGGLGGPAVRPKAMADIARARDRYGTYFTLVGAGGVTKGIHIRDYIRAGADLVQATSICYAHNLSPSVYTDLLTEYSELED